MMRLTRALFPAIVAALLLPTQVHAQFGALTFLAKMMPTNPALERGEKFDAIRQQAASGDLKGAIVLAEQLVTDDAKHSQGFNPLKVIMPGFSMNTGVQQSAGFAAELHVRAREYDRAIVLYQRALDSVPRALAAAGPRPTMKVKVKLAGAYEKSGNLNAAREIYSVMLAETEQNANAYLGERQLFYSELGRLALAAKDIPAARHYLDLAINNLIQISPSGFTSYTTGMNNMMALAKGAATSLGRNMDLMDSEGVLVGQDGEARTEKHAMMAIESPFMDLAEIYRSRSDRESLRRLYENKFTSYASNRQVAAPKSNIAGIANLELTINADLELLYARFGTYLAAVGMDEQAHDAFGKARQLNAARLESLSRTFTSEMLSTTFASRREILGAYLSFALTQRPKNTEIMRKLAGDAMQSKALESEMLAELNRAIALSRDTEVQSLRRRIGEAPNFQERTNLAVALHGKVASLMQSLRFEDGTLFLDRVGTRIGDATLVSVLQFRPFDFTKQQFDVPRYLGISLTRGKMSAVDIGLASEINALASRARSEMARPANSVAANPALAKALYARLLQPLIGPNMPPGRYIADMDGAISMLPLETLVDGTGRYLIEQGSWTYVSSARAMLRKQDRAAPSNAAIVIVNPDFTAGVSAKSDPATLAFFQNSKTLRAADGAVLSSVSFNPLPETMEEGQAVAAAMRRMNSQVAIMSGAGSTSSALHGAHAPRFLHIATHGFFLEDAGTSRQYGGSKDGRTYTLEARDPGLNSGLAFAGANNTISSGQGDGILFSSQIRQLDLQGTELVVLSACDTGVGTVKVGEGVESLRQALELAGARSTVTSLWKVPSLATRDLMVAFYDAMASGASKPEAMRQAKIRIMKTSPQPFYWGAFVMSGMD